MAKKVKAKCIETGLGLLLYIAALLAVYHWEIQGKMRLLVFIVPYLALSLTACGRVLHNIKKHRIFDENALMLIATIGAIIVGRYTEAVGAMLFFQVGKTIEVLSLNRTRKSITKFMDIRPEYANLKIHGEEIVVNPGDLKPGQIIVIKPGEKIPVDAIVTLGSSMVDTKALTGESEPREVRIGRKIYSGSINIRGVIEARVEKVSEDSTASRIMSMVENANNDKADSENFVDKFNRYYTPTVTLMGILVMILPPMILPGHNVMTWVYRGLVFLVAACPCGLLISVPLAFLGGIGAASRQGVLIKGSKFLESLSKTETFVFDKTGTLTEGVFRVKQISPKGIEPDELLEITAYGEAYSNHPIAVSLRKEYNKNIDTKRIKSIREYSGFGVCAEVDGKEVCIGNAQFMNKMGFFYQPVNKIGTAVHVAVNGQYSGYILIADKIRDDVKPTILWMRQHNLVPVILTGDNERVADDVAGQLGIEESYSELMPEDKVNQVQEFMENQLEDEKLAFVGDGINDAPVLALADIGIAMGGLGADAALEAADIILMEDELSKIINAVRISKGTIRAVKQNMIFAIGMKVILLFMASIGYVSMQNAILADMAVMLINILNSFWVLKYPE